MTDSGKRSSLLRHVIHYSCGKLYIAVSGYIFSRDVVNDEEKLHVSA